MKLFFKAALGVAIVGLLFMFRRPISTHSEMTFKGMNENEMQNSSVIRLPAFVHDNAVALRLFIEQLHKELPQRLAKRAEFFEADTHAGLSHYHLKIDGIWVPDVDLVYDATSGHSQRVAGDLNGLGVSFESEFPKVSELEVKDKLQFQLETEKYRILDISGGQKMWTKARGMDYQAAVAFWVKGIDPKGKRINEMWQVSAADAQVLVRRPAFIQ